MPDVEFRITATDDSGHATNSAADGFEHVGHEADKAKRRVDDLGDETGHLARKMLEARAAAAALARQFDKTGDASLLKDFEKMGREAAKLGRALKAIEPPMPHINDKDKNGLIRDVEKVAEESALTFGKIFEGGIVNGLSDAFKAMPPEAKAAVIAGLSTVVAAAMPEIVGTIAGVATAGVATGGIVAALTLASKDPKVQQTYKELGTRVFTSLKADATPFSGLLLELAPKFGAAFDAQEPRIQRIFQALVGPARALATAALKGVELIAPALERASIVGGHILTNLAPYIPALAASTAQLLNAFSAMGPGASASLELILAHINGLIKLAALFMAAYGPVVNLWGRFVESTGVLGREHGHLVQMTDKSSAAAASAAASYDNLAFSIYNTADQAQQLNDAFHRLFEEQMGVDEANLQVNMGMQNLKQTIKDNKKTLDEHTQAGAENANVILQQIRLLVQQRDAAIAAGNGTAEATAQANAAYQHQIQALRAVLIQMGLNAAQVDALISAYERIPSNITTTITTVYRTVGNKSGISDEATGHSRTGTADYGGLSSWRPALFAASGRAAFQASGGGGGGHTPAVSVHSEDTFNVMLDGRPFRAIVRRTTSAAEKRNAWRARAGRR